MTPYTIESPRPRPVSPLVEKNGSNARRRTVSDMPTPGVGHRHGAPASVEAGADRDRAAARHRVHRVVEQLHDGLEQLRLGPDELRVGPKVGDQLDGRAPRRRLVSPPARVCSTARWTMSFRSTGANGSAGRERLNSWIRAERVDAGAGGDLDLVKARRDLPGLLPRGALHEELGAAENARQHVVEDVADSARHVQERLHLLVDGDPAGPRGQLVLRVLQLLEPPAEPPELLLVDPRGVADHLAHDFAVDGHLPDDLHRNVPDDLLDHLDRDLPHDLALDRHLPDDLDGDLADRPRARPGPPAPLP